MPKALTLDILVLGVLLLLQWLGFFDILHALGFFDLLAILFDFFDFFRNFGFFFDFFLGVDVSGLVRSLGSMLVVMLLFFSCLSFIIIFFSFHFLD